LWHTGETGFASVRNGDHVEHVAIRGRVFRQWLTRQFFFEAGKTAGEQAVRDAVATLEGMAVFDGPEHETAVHIAEYDGATFIDLCDAQWRAVKVTAGGWTGTASGLLARLEELAGDAARRPGWPKRPHNLSSELRRLAPELRRAGVVVDFARAGGRSRARLFARGRRDRAPMPAVRLRAARPVRGRWPLPSLRRLPTAATD
jgi:hypothetical protein